MWQDAFMQGRDSTFPLQFFLGLKGATKMHKAAKIPTQQDTPLPPSRSEPQELSTGKGKSSLMKFLLWRCSLPLVLGSSSSWDHPPSGCFKAVLMFYDSFSTFLQKKKES